MGDAERVERGAGAGMAARASRRARRGGRIGAAEKDVLGDAEARDEGEFLMDEAQAEPMRLGRAADRRRRRRRARSRQRPAAIAPARILISVLLPAPFSPISASVRRTRRQRGVAQRDGAAIGFARRSTLSRVTTRRTVPRRAPRARTASRSILHIGRGDEPGRHIDHALPDLLAGEPALDRLGGGAARSP